ncbi:MAG TPA: AAA-like domain-containing protein [Blastocatellia bacterium]|nr:AAA-like domain-containing protein [Blastocatellia bacterium]
MSHDDQEANLPTSELQHSSEERTGREQDPNIGIVLKDRYAIERELGRGGIGVVYLAHDHQLVDKPVVIKVLLAELGDSEELLWLKRKFLHEIEALARIDHPGVVGALDVGQMPDGRQYLVMQFVEGINLRSAMKVEGMDFARTSRIVQQISHALNAAHDKGVYHRDLKPENIMLQAIGGGEEYVKLIDFGIATVKDSQMATNRQTTAVVGTLAYMAPEQLMGRPMAASDVYALGIITYEMLTGRKPYYPESPYQLYELHKMGVKIKPADLRPGIPDAAQEVILRALSFDPRDRHSCARDFGDEFARALTLGSQIPTYSWSQQEETYVPQRGRTAGPAPMPGRSEIRADLAPLRVVLLYKRNIQPDEQVLILLESHLLAQGHSVFIDRHLAIGVEWAREIERQVRTADAVIPLLSASSVTSEMLSYEVQIAHDASQKQHGKPRLLPVRINYSDPLPDPLAGVLDPLQYALWTGPPDNQRLAAEVTASLRPAATIKPPSKRKLEAVGGAVPLDSEFYIVRPTDEEFCSSIARQDSIVLVKGGRQMGKTSLLARGLQQARQAGARVVLTDFQKLNAAHLESVESLFMTLAELIADQLDLDVMPDQVWNPRRGPSMNFERYIRREVLEKIAGPLVWGMDEVDRLFSCDYGSEVFGLFRSWHNERSLDPSGPWQRLTLAIVYATEAHLFITDVNQSPFNVGIRLVLDDFNFDQVAELNRRYGMALQDRAEVARYFRLVSGHPYLVRRGLHEIATRGTKLVDLEAVADKDEGPFGDHLRRILVLLAQDPALCDVVRGVLQGNHCPTTESFYRLRSAGLMTGDSARDGKLRCQLYSNYLERHLL